MMWNQAPRALGVAFLAMAIVFSQAAHAGFFEQFFGGYEPRPGGDAVQPQARGRSQRQVHRLMRTLDDKPVLQTPTDIMHDQTLRPGDAVMMKSGIEIFTGHRGATHDESDFTPLNKVRHVRPRERLALALLDSRSPAALPPHASFVSERPAFVSPAVAFNAEAGDAKNHAVRYVGP